MKKINVKFVDFFSGFDQTYNGIYILLSKFFKLEISDEPDFIIYSCWGQNHLNYSCTKIFLTLENVRPNFFLADFAVGFDFIDRPNYLRLPLYVFWKDYNHHDLLYPKFNTIIEENKKSKFCCFVVSNPIATERIDFFNKLSLYKKIDSGGKFLNNVGGPIGDKHEFMKPYRFMIAFENSSYPGYVTEKIYECFFTNTIPIYWGSQMISRDFNPKRILDRNSFESDDVFINKIIELEENPDLYREFILQPVFNDNKSSIYFEEKRVFNFFNKVFEGEKNTKSVGIRKKVGVLLRKKRNFEKKYFVKLLR